MESGHGSRNRKSVSRPLKGRKERDGEDLHLFRELLKREKERPASLLLPVSDDFDHNNGNSAFYRIQSIKKESGIGFLCESSKSDYDWLKTPPATPLFPSLEMEATAPHFIVQREIPLLHPFSQLQAASNSEATKRSSEMAKPATTKQKVPSRSTTPSHRLQITSSTEPKNTKLRTTTPTANQRTTTQPIIKSTNPKQVCMDFLSSNLSKEPAYANPNPHHRTRTKSPLVRSTMTSQIPPEETPSNLRTNRSASATRGRQLNQTAAACQRSEQMNPRRQSCSPSVTRGRKVEAKPENGGENLSIKDQKRTHGGSEMRNVLGSRMVEKVMNARKANGNEERDGKPQPRSGINEKLNFVGLTTKTPRQLIITRRK